MQRSVTRNICVVGLLALFACGCGSDPYSVASVSGQVLVDGEPANGARVSFEPIGNEDSPNPGPGSFGRTDEEGRYTLKIIGEDDGAVVGKHRVRISMFEVKETPDGEMQDVSKEALPARYNANTELEFEVPADGTEEADFKLESK